MAQGYWVDPDTNQGHSYNDKQGFDYSNPMNILGMLGVGGGVGGMLSSLFGGGGKMKNPADAAMPYLNQIPGTVKPYYDPYVNAGQQALGNNQQYQQAGQQALPQLQGQYNQMISDPSAILKMLGGGYEQSPGYQFSVDQATQAAKQAAAAGGMVGSPQHQQEIASTITGLANQDYGNYLSQALGLYGGGLQGLEGINQKGYDTTNNMTQMGYGASNELAQSLANALMGQGNLAYAGVQNKNAMKQSQNQQNQGLFGSLAGLGSAALMFA